VASEYPDLSLLEGTIHPRILEAMEKASAQLTAAGVRHALVGGLAVGAYGWPRWSKDVDFLVGDEAFIVHGGGFVTLAPGVPISYGEVPIDSISMTANEPFLVPAVDRPIVREGIPIAPVEALIYLKLKSPRSKDRTDVVELVKAGIDATAIERWLSENAPGMVKKFVAVVRQAESESEE